jgi:hypothetical protein
MRARLLLCCMLIAGLAAAALPAGGAALSLAPRTVARAAVVHKAAPARKPKVVCRVVRRRVHGRLVKRKVCAPVKPKPKLVCHVVRRVVRVYGRRRVVRRKVCVPVKPKPKPKPAPRPAPAPAPAPGGGGTAAGGTTGGSSGGGGGAGGTTGTGTGTGTGSGTGTGTSTDPGYPGGPGPTYEHVDLISNNTFENADDPVCFASFSANDGDGTATTTTANAIDGRSLAVTVNPYGRLGCGRDWSFHEGPIGKRVTLEGQVRVNSPTHGEADLQVCAIIYYEDVQQNLAPCQTVHSDGSGAVVPVSITQDTTDADNPQGRRLDSVTFQLQDAPNTTANMAIDATLDNVHLYVDEVAGSEGPRGGGGGGGGGNGDAGCVDVDGNPVPEPTGPPVPGSRCDANVTPPPFPSYTPAPINLPPLGTPAISLADYRNYQQQDDADKIFTKFTDWVNRAVLDDDPDGEYTSADAVVYWYLTGEQDNRYIDDAIRRVDAMVQSENAKVAAGETPDVGGDDYLNAGGIVEELALTYDYGYGRLSDDQKQRWKQFGDQVVANIWNPSQAEWGGVRHTWSGWAINDPGNNYFYSFLQATELWALATRNMDWAHFLQTQKFPLIESYLSKLAGGGSREGSGYGASQRLLWEDARMWRSSTGEDLPVVRAHARQSIDYWINATVPTMDFFAPVGDQSRVSEPLLFDYHANLVREAILADPGSPEAQRGEWWLHQIVPTVPLDLTQSFKTRWALLAPAAKEPQQAPDPTALFYSAPGVGQLFARSSWNKTASWLQFTAGPYDQGHAHMDQGGFTFYRNTWLTAPALIWSHSGLQGGGFNADLGPGANDVVRFYHLPAPGTPPDAPPPPAIHQDMDSNGAPPTVTQSGSTVSVHADLTHAYADTEHHPLEVRSWTRDLTYNTTDSTLRVQDACQVSSGIGAAFQLQVPVQPTVNGDGTSLDAGKLHVTFPSGYQVEVTRLMDLDPDFEVDHDDGPPTSAYRIDLTNPSACAFDVTLKANP